MLKRWSLKKAKSRENKGKERRKSRTIDAAEAISTKCESEFLSRSQLYTDFAVPCCFIFCSWLSHSHALLPGIRSSKWPLESPLAGRCQPGMLRPGMLEVPALARRCHANPADAPSSPPCRMHCSGAASVLLHPCLPKPPFRTNHTAQKVPLRL